MLKPDIHTRECRLLSVRPSVRHTSVDLQCQNGCKYQTFCTTWYSAIILVFSVESTYRILTVTRNTTVKVLSSAGSSGKYRSSAIESYFMLQCIQAYFMLPRQLSIKYASMLSQQIHRQLSIIMNSWI